MNKTVYWLPLLHHANCEGYTIARASVESECQTVCFTDLCMYIFGGEVGEASGVAFGALDTLEAEFREPLDPIRGKHRFIRGRRVCEGFLAE